MVAHAKAQAVFARNLGPGADDVFLGTHVDRVPGVMLGIVIVEVVMVVRQRDEIFRACLDVEVHQRFRFPFVGLPKVIQLHEPEFRGMAVSADVIIILSMALDIHLARIPIALLRNALRRPMRPHPKLRVAKPFRTMIIAGQRFPSRRKGAGDRFARSRAAQRGTG